MTALRNLDVPRLLWVNHFAVAPDMGGGTRHFEMARELVRRGWRVMIVASDFHLHGRSYMRRSGPQDRAAHTETIDGVEFTWLWAAPYERNDWRRAWNWVSFGRSLERWIGTVPRPSVVIGSTPHLFAALATWRAARKLRTPFLLEVRDLWPESLAVGGGRRGPAYLGLQALAAFLYRVSDRIIVLARGVREYLIHRGVAPTRIRYAPNGVDVAAYATVPRVPRPTLRFVYAGAHGPANGLDAVIDAASALRHHTLIEFCLVGDGPSKPALMRAASERGLSNVRFLEPVSKTAMPGLLASCDAGLMVLKDVHLFSFGVSPNKLFDYWGAGLPVICNVTGEVAEFVKESGGGIQAVTASGADLAQAISRLAAMTADERMAMGARGRAWVKRERDRPVLAAQFDAMLREALVA